MWAEVPILVSAAAMLTSQFRITFSLVVIMMETTSSIHIFAPMMFGCIIASKVADQISPSFYEKNIAMKKLNIIPHHPPQEMKELEARDFMSEEQIVTVHSVMKVGDFHKVLHGTSHHAFPVVNSANKCVGLIPKKMIVTLIVLRAFYNRDVLKDKKKDAPTAPHTEPVTPGNA